MCVKNSIELSLNSDTFSGLKENFDTVLARTIGNMEMKGADEATITLKLLISTEKTSIGGETPQEITRPTFKHDISSVMQVKDKMSGTLAGDYALVWDDEEKKYVMKRITNGQLSLFDNVDEDEDSEDEVERYEAPVESEHIPELIEASSEDRTTPFEWICQFIDKKLHITEAMGNYTVRTEDNKVVLTSASAEDSPFHCDKEILEKHIGHNIVCVGYGSEQMDQVNIECEDCIETLFTCRFNGSDTVYDGIEVTEEESESVTESDCIEADVESAEPEDVETDSTEYADTDESDEEYPYTEPEESTEEESV